MRATPFGKLRRNYCQYLRISMVISQHLSFLIVGSNFTFLIKICHICLCRTSCGSIFVNTSAIFVAVGSQPTWIQPAAHASLTLWKQICVMLFNYYDVTDFKKNLEKKWEIMTDCLLSNQETWGRAHSNQFPTVKYRIQKQLRVS